jgi:hypothetical protein
MKILDRIFSSGFGEHAKQEAREAVDQLASSFSPVACLVPDRGARIGFRFTRLETKHRIGLAIDRERSPGYLPHEAVLRELKRIDDKRTVFLPELYSPAAQRNIRFAAILPPAFSVDRKEPYDVIALAPESPPGSTIAALLEDGLREKIDALLAQFGLLDAIVVLPERLEHRTDGMKASEVDRLARAVINEDIVPYVQKHMNGQPAALATFTLPKFEELGTAAAAPHPNPPPPGEG